MIAGLMALSVQARNTSTAIFDPDFKSLQVLKIGDRLGQPIIKLHSDDSGIRISFDELAEDNRFLRYRLVHCNSDWQPSMLSETDYLDGFNEAQVVDYALSERTLTHYVHYNIDLPNPEMTPLVSGNYLVEVFDEDDPGKILLQARFMVDEATAGLSMGVTSRTDYDYNNRHQQLSVKADLKGAKVDNPYNDLKLVLVKNGQESSRRELKHPLSVLPETAVYEHQKELIYPAGNEYRRFEVANIHYPGMGVESIEYIDPYYRVMLKTDSPRYDVRYTYDQDQSGRFFPAELNADDADINADYVMVYFTLQSPKLADEVFLEGDLAGRALGPESRMVYDETIGAYIKTLLLKQGLYNYQYVTSAQENPIEGDRYETDNEYVALLYYCPPSARYERLIATGVIHSGK